jgi:hypothetical protein
MADNATEMRSHEAVPLKEGNTLLSELLSGYVYVEVKMPLYVENVVHLLDHFHISK